MKSIEEPKQSDTDFCFICYSHSDRETIQPDIDFLESQGISVWFDEHISIGEEWNNTLALRIQNCSKFILFVSAKSVESQHCRDEINYAQQHKKPILAIEVSPTQVSPGLQLILNKRQILFRHQQKLEVYRRQLLHAFKAGADKSILHESRTASLQGLINPDSRKSKWVLAFIFTVTLSAIAFAVATNFQWNSQFDFAERDYIVVGDLESRTQDPLLGDTLETSLRIALEQSIYAKVLPELVMRDAKERMQLDPDVPLNREATIEIAQREGAKAALLGSISEVNDTFNISVELVSSRDGASVWGTTVHAARLDLVLEAIDNVSRQIREQLGETLASIESTTLPLAKVTTSNIEALRAYSLAEKSVATGDWETGIDLFERALAIDTEFAMAHGKIAAVYVGRAKSPAMAATHYDAALRNDDRLSQREKLYLEASSTWHKTPDEMRSAWKTMSVMYPNEGVGFNNLGEVLNRYYLDFSAASIEYRASSERIEPWQYIAFYNLAESLLALGDVEGAIKNLTTSYDMYNDPLDFALADAYVVANRHEQARQFLASGEQSEAANLRLSAQLKLLGYYGDLGKIDEALALITFMNRDTLSNVQKSVILAAEVALRERGDNKDDFRLALSNAVAFELQRLEVEPAVLPNEKLTHLAILARIAIRNDANDLVESALDYVNATIPSNGFPIDQALYELLQSELAFQQGEFDSALNHIQRSLDHAEMYQTYELQARVYQMMGDESNRLVALHWLRDHRGLAFAEKVNWYYYQMFNILEWSHANSTLAAIAEESPSASLSN